MLARMTTPNRLRWRTMAIVTTASSVSSTVLMRDSMAASRRPDWSTGREPAAAVFRQQRLDALVQAGLRERVRHDGAGEEEQRQQKHELQRHQAEAGLQAHAKDQKADAERVGDAGRVHAGEDFRHAHEPERADDGEERSEQDEHPARNLDDQRHDLSSSSTS